MQLSLGDLIGGKFLSNLRKTAGAGPLSLSEKRSDATGPSKADPGSFKSFRHTRHTLVVKFVEGIDYAVGLLFVFFRRMY